MNTTPKLIVLDLDGVIYDFPDAMRRWYMEKEGRLATELPEPESWNFPIDSWGIESMERFEADMYAGIKDGLVFGTGDPIRGVTTAFTILEALRAAGTRIQVVTHRGPTLAIHAIARALTRAWLYDHNLGYDQLNVVRTRDQKAPTAQVYARQLGLHPGEVWCIDDNLDNCVDFRDAGFRTVLGARLSNLEAYREAPEEFTGAIPRADILTFATMCRTGRFLR